MLTTEPWRRLHLPSTIIAQIAGVRLIAASFIRSEQLLVSLVIPAMVLVALGAFAFQAPGGQQANSDEDPQLTVRVPDESSGMYDIPLRASIQSIEAEAFGMSTILSEKLPDVPPFTVPASHWSSILEHLRRPRVDREPRLGWPAIGRLKITQNDGRVIDVTYYWYKSKRCLHYSIRGVRCFDDRGGTDGDVRDEAMWLDYQVRDAYRCMTGHITTEPIVNKDSK